MISRGLRSLLGLSPAPPTTSPPAATSVARHTVEVVQDELIQERVIAVDAATPRQQVVLLAAAATATDDDHADDDAGEAGQTEHGTTMTTPLFLPSPSSMVRRALFDDIASAEECAILMAAGARGFEALSFAAGPSLDDSLPPLVPDAEELIGQSAAALAQRIAVRMRNAVCQGHGLVPSTKDAGGSSTDDDSGLALSGSLLCRLLPPPPPPPSVSADSSRQEEIARMMKNYWAPHIDKANRLEYDFSSVLYLNSLGSDFGGGRFAFIDGDGVDRLLEPRAGRLVTFHGGADNLHRVEPVEWGERWTLSCWFSQRSGGPQ